MPRPFALWDPSWNADLVQRSTEGPLVVSMPDSPTPAQLERFEKLVAVLTHPVLYADDNVHYVQRLSAEGGTSPHKGAKVEQYQWLPQNLTFPAPGPDPFDLSNLYAGVQYRYANVGYRLLLRGWVGSMDDGTMNGEFRVKWADDETRNAADLRAAWTGLVLGVFDTDAPRQDHVLDVLHGKRETDPSWTYHGGWLDRVPLPGPEVVNESVAVLDGINSGEARIVISGGSPLWNVTLQYYDGAWIDIATYGIDLRSHLVAPPNEVGLMMQLFSGVGVNKPAIPPAIWPTQTIWFSEIEMPMFEPFVPDLADWSEREWAEHWSWLTPAPPYSLELRRPKIDLAHMPLGSPRAPAELRYSDPDLGICVKLAAESFVAMLPFADNRFVDLGPGAFEAFAPPDVMAYGPDAPMSCYIRGRFDNLESWGTDRGIISFGDLSNPVPAVFDNGIGVYWHPTGPTTGQFVARCHVLATGWVDVPFDVDAAEWSDRPIDIGFVYTGARGTSSGMNDYELRVVVDGVTRASAVVGPIDCGGTVVIQMGSLGAWQGYQGLFRGGAVWGDALTDYDLRRAFLPASEGFYNPSFEEADSSGRPGEAERWLWHSHQEDVEWAEFNAYDAALEQWQTAMEEFGPGWNDLESWIDSLDDATIVAALFNAGVTLFESTFEDFGLWLVWNGAAYVVGTPWRDDFVNVQPFEDTLGPYGGPTGFDSWYDELYGTNILPLEIEAFDEAWGNDSFSTSGPMWSPGTAQDAVLRGKPLTFPLEVPPDKALLVVITDVAGPGLLHVTPGTYNTIGDLIVELQTQWDLYIGFASGIAWGSWSEGGEEGLTFGWDGVSFSAMMIMFGELASQTANDLRETIGMIGFGINGAATRLVVGAWLFPPIPTVDPTDKFYYDNWSLIDFVVDTDPYMADYPLVYEQYYALFDTAVPDPTCVERFTLEGWVSPSAVWIDEYSPTDLAAAMFDGGTVNMEEFDPAEWPDEIWT